MSYSFNIYSSLLNLHVLKEVKTNAWIYKIFKSELIYNIVENVGC